MARKKAISDQKPGGVKGIKGRDLPKLILSLVVLFGALGFILTELGVFKSKTSTEKLNILPKPTPISSSLGHDGNNDGVPDDLDAIKGCEQVAPPTVAQPGRNCLISPYNPGADPINEPEGRDNPFKVL